MSDAADLFGFADLHNHQFADLAFGGRVVYGAAGGPLADLSGCRRDHGPHGVLDLVGNVSTMLLDRRGPAALLGHRSRGWPDFADWPRWDSYTHQGVHHTWLRRAVDGGLRLMVMLAVHNMLLCGATRMSWRKVCGTLETVRFQLDGARRLEAEIDDECGGRGRGWYRIVNTPDEASEVIASGRLAVVLGVEVDDLFDLHDTEVVDDHALDAVVERCVALGVHHLIPIHFADNGVGGAAFQVVSWAKDQRPFGEANPFGSLPLYPVDTADGSADGYTYRGGRVNAVGLTAVGRRLIERLMRRGILIDVEHMSARARSDTLDIAESLNLPVVSGHAAFRAIDRPAGISERELTDRELDRIARLGGMVAPIVRQSGVDPDHLGGPGPSDTARGLLAAYRYAVDRGLGRPVAVGTDLNGFAGGTRPRFGTGIGEDGTPVVYPFRTEVPGAPLLERGVSGRRAFDINIDGLAHVGLLPDLVAELGALGATSAELIPLMRSAQGYLEVWRSCAQ